MVKEVGKRVLLNAMLTPAPTTEPIGAKIQKATFQCWRRKKLEMGKERNIMGQAIAHPRMTPPVPNLCWRGGKARSVQRAWEMPIAPKKIEIWRGVKPKPPSFVLVNQKRGMTEMGED